ncbi:hypothetical protein [Kordiimonas sp. SCSIO 12610]|uniref:hypothetical protein n=1 Tax=Kordiimonas sp. SCSIO 12610 TaxID=2829597 RepID=UPI00210875BC|nr:hypothetical protein [Kordiimonas sp. SCSIO 12610]UTW56155.1 hypothetical protein KFF44_04465 [Kordiimonas sp. SCSIO 12610]
MNKYFAPLMQIRVCNCLIVPIALVLLAYGDANAFADDAEHVEEPRAFTRSKTLKVPAGLTKDNNPQAYYFFDIGIDLLSDKPVYRWFNDRLATREYNSRERYNLCSELLEPFYIGNEGFVLEGIETGNFKIQMPFSASTNVPMALSAVSREYPAFPLDRVADYTRVDNSLPEELKNFDCGERCPNLDLKYDRFASTYKLPDAPDVAKNAWIIYSEHSCSERTGSRICLERIDASGVWSMIDAQHSDFSAFYGVDGVTNKASAVSGFGNKIRHSSLKEISNQTMRSKYAHGSSILVRNNDQLYIYGFWTYPNNNQFVNRKVIVRSANGQTRKLTYKVDTITKLFIHKVDRSNARIDTLCDFDFYLTN